MIDWRVFWAVTLAPVPWVVGWALVALLMRGVSDERRAGALLWLIVAFGILVYAALR